MNISWHPEGFRLLSRGVLSGLATTRFLLGIMALLYVMKGKKVNRLVLLKILIAQGLELIIE